MQTITGVSCNENINHPYLCETLSIFSTTLPDIADNLVQRDFIDGSLGEDALVSLAGSKFFEGMVLACAYYSWPENIPARKELLRIRMQDIFNEAYLYEQYPEQFTNYQSMCRDDSTEAKDFLGKLIGMILVYEVYIEMGLDTKIGIYSSCAGQED